MFNFLCFFFLVPTLFYWHFRRIFLCFFVVLLSIYYINVFNWKSVYPTIELHLTSRNRKKNMFERKRIQNKMMTLEKKNKKSIVMQVFCVQYVYNWQLWTKKNMTKMSLWVIGRFLHNDDESFDPLKLLSFFTRWIGLTLMFYLFWKRRSDRFNHYRGLYLRVWIRRFCWNTKEKFSIINRMSRRIHSKKNTLSYDESVFSLPVSKTHHQIELPMASFVSVMENRVFSPIPCLIKWHVHDDMKMTMMNHFQLDVS